MMKLSAPSQKTFSLTAKSFSLLEEHDCRVQPTSKTQTESVEQWTDVMLKCRELDINLIPTVLCHADCVDPINCTKLRNLKGVPVNTPYVVAKNGSKSEIELPVACKCVPRYATGTCLSYE